MGAFVMAGVGWDGGEEGVSGKEEEGEDMKKERKRVWVRDYRRIRHVYWFILVAVYSCHDDHSEKVLSKHDFGCSLS